MIKHLKCSLFTALFIALAVISCSEGTLSAQVGLGKRFQVDDTVDQLELISGAARRLKFKYDIPELVLSLIHI